MSHVASKLLIPLAFLASTVVAQAQSQTTTQTETLRIDELRTGGSVGVNLSGSGIPIGVFESGGTNIMIDTAVSDLSHVTNSDGGTISSHATTVTKILTSSGVTTPSELGVAPSASVYVYGIENTHEAFATELGNAIQSQNLLVSNHSYFENNGWTSGSFWTGVIDMSETEDYKFGYYGDWSRTFDSLMYVYPYHLIVKAVGNDRGAGNTATPFSVYSTSSFDVLSRSTPIPEPDGGSDGYDCLSRDSSPKNALVVGAVDNISGGYSTPSDISLANSSHAFGPSDDARIKPDLVGPGQLTAGTAFTSYSAPTISGLAALLQELNRSENGRWMKSSTVKALLIHTADPITADGSPTAQVGWGIPNAESAANFILNGDGNQRMVEGSIANGESLTFRIYLDGASDFRATMVWTDPHGTSPSLEFNSSDLDDSTAILVHDLDMELWQESGPSLLAQPWKLSAANPSHAASRGDNNVDNVERIDYPAGSITAGWYTVRINHDGAISGSQEFSLLINDAQGITFSSGSWSTAPSSWDDHVFVRITDTVNIANISSNVTISHLEMEAGTDLHIDEVNTVNVVGEILLKATSTSTAQIKGPINGIVHRQSYITGSAGWRYFWSPLRTTIGEWTEELTRVNLSGSSSPSVYTWDAGNVQWTSLAASDSAHEGAISLYMGSNAFAQFTQLPFSKSTRGNPDSRHSTVSLTVDNDVSDSDDDLGWNLIGHPYLAPVDWQALDVSETNGSFYIWNTAQDDYAVSDGTIFTNGGRRYIYPGQSFWVYCPSGSAGTLLMDTASVVLSTDEPLLKKELPTVRVQWWMSNGMLEETVLQLHPNATFGLDPMMDIPDRNGADPNRASLHWLTDGKPLVISRVLNAPGYSELSWSAGQYGMDSVTIELRNAEGWYFYWRDGVDQYRLRDVPRSVWLAGGNIELHWNAEVIGLNESDKSDLYYRDGAIHWTGESALEVEVYDMSGRVIDTIRWDSAGIREVEHFYGTFIARSDAGHVLKFVN